MRQPVSFEVGNLRVDVVSDGDFAMDAGGVFGLVPRPLWEPLAGAPDALNRVPLALNCLLVRDGRHTALIDTGIGNKIPERQRERAYPGDYGHLLDSLRAVGVQPGDVDIVINTHLHFDHCGWNTALVHGATIPTFPNARYYIERGEWEAAMQPNERTRATYLADNLLPAHEAGLVELVDGERQVTPSIRMLPTPGHTADHAAVVISSGGETAVYLGDLIQHATQLERMAWIAAFDTLPLVSLETKKRLVEQALLNDWLLISTHAPYPGAGRMAEDDGRRKFVAALLDGGA